ncbi:chaperone protein EcpD [Rhodanobacter sp. ANJX3]|uniref:fimbrial biogenesis chaperone n=1 Tax=unclassified Rhodanobacter TaxID=2621553 RepID=UPI0015C9D4E3|nr:MULTISPECIES: fimbria/pilus periplasmic chaperone [unclassified Rhodanobacter]MBB5359326.1 chaperone protein EcpD [Rhodanobacter sp. ANJX3]NYE29922.1 chaperone protein EcpD [Rhodanobacter sp. K2T2]
MKSMGCGVLSYAFALLFCANVAQASVIIGGTRVIFPAKDGEVTLRLSNDSARPALIEAWVDRGDPKSTPEKVDAPFLITPPLFRIEAHKDQSLRIIATPAPLPTDRESLFWLNVLEIPPKPSSMETQDKNTLQLAIHSRLKLFYRPDHLPGDPLKVPAQLIWKVAPQAQGYVLDVRNPTPYHITITDLSVNVGGKSYASETGMIDPLGVLRLTIKGLSQAPAAGTPVNYVVVNDYGAATTFSGTIAP